MKYYRLHIDSKDSNDIYSNISLILDVEPMSFDDGLEGNQDYSLWTFGFDESEEDDQYDFINKFLDLVEPNLVKLEEIGVCAKDITIWLNYEYVEQCSLEFHSDEMRRLGDSGITLCLDCFEKK